MRAGYLNTRLILQRDDTPPAGSGRNAGQAWQQPTDIATLPANVRNLTGRELQAGALAENTGQYAVTVRWRPDITDKSRLVWRRPGAPDRHLYAVHVPIGARAEFLEILCEEQQ